MRKIAGLLLMFAGASGAMFAIEGVPEIDPANGTAALALLAGGLLMLRTRRKR